MLAPLGSYAAPIKSRPPQTPLQWLHALTFNAVFQLSMLAIHTLQLFILFIFHVHPATLHIYNVLATWSKDLFSRLLILISMLWAPTTLRIYTDEDDEELDLRKIVYRDQNGVPIGLDLPERIVIMANHQVYCDWSYIWNLLYFASLQHSLTIILKASLKWVPMVGPAMQIFRFIFMKRNWQADKIALGKSLAKLGQRARRSMDPVVLLIFPEGTLVSKDTRPISRRYAEKVNIEDCKHTLLPRSTGLLYCLRALEPVIPEMRLLDITIGYPGIPRGGYGQDYYTLQSIFGAGIPPPIVHMHIRSYQVKYQVPIGNARISSSAEVAESTAEEKKQFDDWLLKRWRLKDERLENFISYGTLQVEGVKSPFVDIPIKFRRNQELVGLLASCIFGLWLTKISVKFVWSLISG